MLRKEQVADWVDANQLDPSLLELDASATTRPSVEVLRHVGNWLLRNFQYPCSNESAVVWAQWHLVARPQSSHPHDKA